MSEFVISTRYANALIAISEEKKAFEKVVQDVSFVLNTLNDSKELRNLVVSPIISSEKKSNILREIFESHVGSEVNNFLMFLIEKGRENILFNICQRFLSLSNEKLNQVDVNIISAIQLDESQKKNIKEKLETIIKKNVISTFTIDKNIIGGFKAKFNDTVIDASIQHQLELLKKKLFEEDYLKN